MMLDGVSLILEERVRQKQQYSSLHDTDHRYGELLMLAECLVNQSHDATPFPEWAHWERNHLIDKYKDDKKKLLAIAGALIAAELDRLIDETSCT